jgi:protein-tyrosine phosphatase
MAAPLIQVSEAYRDFLVFHVTDDLYLGNLPHTREHVARLRDAGVKTVVNLVEDREYYPGQRLELEAAYQEAGVSEQRLQMVDQSAHEDEVFDWVLEVFQEARANGPVLIHCRGGRERSVTAAAAVLVAEEGMPVTEALEFLNQIFDLARPLTHQREALERWVEERAATGGTPAADATPV